MMFHSPNVTFYDIGFDDKHANWRIKGSSFTVYLCAPRSLCPLLVFPLWRHLSDPQNIQKASPRRSQSPRVMKTALSSLFMISSSLRNYVIVELPKHHTTCLILLDLSFPHLCLSKSPSYTLLTMAFLQWNSYNSYPILHDSSFTLFFASFLLSFDSSTTNKSIRSFLPFLWCSFLSQYFLHFPSGSPSFPFEVPLCPILSMPNNPFEKARKIE